MDREILKEVINNLYDKPIDSAQNLLFVNRRDEIGKIGDILAFQPQGIYGICGETGVGKTSLMRQFTQGDMKSYFIPVSEKDGKESIVADLIFKISTLVSKDPEPVLREEAEKIRKWIITETQTSNTFSGGFSAFVSAGASHSSSQSNSFNLFEAKEKLQDILSAILKRHGKLLLVVDELDKEKKEEVLLIVDSLKEILFQDNLITMVSLPFSIYREYARDLMRWNEVGNLENIFRGMIFVNPFSEDGIRELIMKRLSKFPAIIPNDVYPEIYRFSDGNPRDALSITQEIFLDNRDGEITRENAVRTMKNKVLKLVEFSKSFTDMQRELLRLIAQKPTDRSSIVRRAANIKKQTVYTFINRYLQEGVLIEKNGLISITGRLYYYFL